ncbi:MAG: SGNH/GDSL hydrolase family protein [Wenzhouxiangellaceae bacterium]
MRHWIFWACLPWLIPQALYVRLTAPRFADAAGPRQGIAAPVRRAATIRDLRLFAIGDSIIAGVGADRCEQALVGQTAQALSQQLSARIHWQALGQTGFHTRQIIDSLLPRIPAQPQDFIIISAGVNDITSLRRINAWRTDMLQLITTLRQHSPKAIIAVAGIPPLGQFPLLPYPFRWLLGLRAALFDQAARELVLPLSRTIYINIGVNADPEQFSADGFHPSAESYQAFGEQTANRMVTMLSRHEHDHA